MLWLIWLMLVNLVHNRIICIMAADCSSSLCVWVHGQVGAVNQAEMSVGVCYSLHGMNEWDLR